MIEGIGRVFTLKEAVKELGTAGIAVKTLRKEIHAGRLRAVTARPSRNSKLLITEDELKAWWDFYVLQAGLPARNRS